MAPIGAATAVMAVAPGGNYWLSLAGAYGGELIHFSGVLLYNVLHLPLESYVRNVDLFIISFCVTITAGAVIGYNWGAEMKSDKSKPAALGWQISLIALKF